MGIQVNIYKQKERGVFMSRTKEYIKVTQVTLADVKAARRAQYEMRRYGLKSVPDESRLFDALNGISQIIAVVSLVFGVGSVAALAGTVCEIASGLSFSSREELKNILAMGEDGLAELEYYFEDYPKVEAIRVKMGYLDYIDDGVRFIQHTSKNYIEEHKIDGRWRV